MRLQVVDNGGLTAETTRSLTIGPTAALIATPNPAGFEEEVTLDGSGSTDATGTITTYEWDLDNNGTFERNTGNVATTTTVYFTFTPPPVHLRVTDDDGLSDVTSLTVTIQAGSAPSSGWLAPFTVRAPAAVQAPAAAGRTFSARLDARPVRGQPGKVLRRGAVQSLRGMLVTGSFKGRLARVRRVPPAEALLAKLLRAAFRARLDASVNARTRTSTTTMLALATIPRDSRSGLPALACLRITIAERPRRKPSGSFRVLGGTGDACRLAATGTFAFTPGRNTPSTLTGRVKARLVGARGVPAACAALTLPRAGVARG